MSKVYSLSLTNLASNLLSLQLDTILPSNLQ